MIALCVVKTLSSRELNKGEYFILLNYRSVNEEIFYRGVNKKVFYVKYDDFLLILVKLSKLKKSPVKIFFNSSVI